jgi:hypothetical protein
MVSKVVQRLRGPSGLDFEVTDVDGVYGVNASGTAEVLSAAKTLTAADNGKTFFLALAGGFTVTLPTPSLGFECEFIVSVAPTTAYIIAAAGGADIIVAGVNELEVDTTEDGPYDDNADVFNFVASTAVVGDRVSFKCDGTKFYGIGQTNADGGVTMATT